MQQLPDSSLSARGARAEDREIASHASESWDGRLKRLGLDRATLIGRSSADNAHRTYRLGDSAYKVAVRDRFALERHQTLEGEFALMRRCADVRGVPAVFDYRRVDGLEVLQASYEPGRRLDRADLGPLARVAAFGRLALVLVRISRRGVSHNDVQADNVLVDDDGRVTIVDFDQAVLTSPLSALGRSFVGRGRPASVPVCGSLLSLLLDPGRNWARRSFPLWLKRLLRRGTTPPLPHVPFDADPALRSLRLAWAIGQRSKASSPGASVAYYSLTERGVLFPGERPWESRWQMLKPTVGPHVERVLELGCNLALLSSSLLREGLVREALAVDHDAEILRGAQLVAEAFDVEPRLEVRDFDAPDAWEDELAGFQPDLVFALNVLEWVNSRERLLAFLGRFRELVFEGHDDLETETGRLRSVGFTEIDVVGRSERQRHVLHCRKTQWPR